LQEGKDSYDDFEILYQKSDKEFKEIRESKEWQPSSNAISFGYHFSPIWIKFDIKNLSKSQDFYLEFSEPFGHIVDFYLLRDKEIEFFPNGLATPLEERAIKTPLPTLKIFLKNGEKVTLYIKYQSKFTSFGEFGLYTENGYDRKELLYNAFYFFYFGGITVIAVYNLFLFLALRDRSYIYYVGYALTFVSWVFLYSGFSLYFIDSDLHYMLHFTTPFAFVFFTFFTQEILDTKKNLPFLNKILDITKFMLLLSAVYVVFDLEYGYLSANLLGLFYFPFGAYVAIMSIKKGVKTAKFYLISFLIFLLTMSVLTNLAMGLVEFSYVAKYSFIVGSMIELVLFSLLLAYKINILKEEKLEAQSKLLESRKSEALRLERVVEVKTEDLKVANTKLQKMIEEREVLLRELHHRVKNNLQVITGMLSIQSHKAKPGTQSELSDILRRIKSMSLVHELLYASDSITQIPTKLYFEKLINSVFSSMGRNGIDLKSEIEDINLNIEETIALGTIVVEAITNSVKHAFGGVENPMIEVELFMKDERCVLSIKDNGIGFDEDSVSSGGLGLKIIQKTASSLTQSKVISQRENTNTGYSFRLEFLPYG